MEVQDVNDLRSRTLPEPPWPSTGNPMLEYIVERMVYDVESGTPPLEVGLWGLANAWFEGGLDAVSRLRHLGAQAEPSAFDGKVRFFRVVFDNDVTSDYEGLAAKTDNTTWTYRHDDSLGGYFVRSSGLHEDSHHPDGRPIFRLEPITKAKAEILANKHLARSRAVPRVHHSTAFRTPAPDGPPLSEPR